VFLYRCDSSADYRIAMKRDISLSLTIARNAQRSRSGNRPLGREFVISVAFYIVVDFSAAFTDTFLDVRIHPGRRRLVYRWVISAIKYD